MTTFVPFVPSPRGPFSFTATLDGTGYQITVTWNAYGQRWYLQCIAPGNVLVFMLPLIGSPDTGDINIVAGYFIANTLVFRVSTQTFEIGP
jgi:uncharacterized protein DUF6983